MNWGLPATVFVDDEGEPVTTFPTSYAYYNLYIDGVLQQGNASVISQDGQILTIPNGDMLDPSTPLIVAFVLT